MSFYEELGDILEEDVDENTVLQDCENWDSLSIMSVMSVAMSKYNKRLTAADFRNITTVKDLAELIQG